MKYIFIIKIFLKHYKINKNTLKIKLKNAIENE